MSTYNIGLFCIVVACLSGVVPSYAASPNLGEDVSATTLAKIDFTVLTDGQGLPQGSGDAKRGAIVYQQHCLACHGYEGQGGVNDQLAGGHGSLGSNSPLKTIGSYWPYATTIFDYVRRAMPYNAPGSLRHDEVYAVTAYLLYINDIISDEVVLNAKTLVGVRMPNVDNFVWDRSIGMPHQNLRKHPSAK